MQITSKFNNKCPQCHDPIEIGMVIEWTSSTGGVHVDCARQITENRFGDLPEKVVRRGLESLPETLLAKLDQTEREALESALFKQVEDAFKVVLQNGRIIGYRNAKLDALPKPSPSKLDLLVAAATQAQSEPTEPAPKAKRKSKAKANKAQAVLSALSGN